LELDDSHVNKFNIFKTQDGGRRHLKNLFLTITRSRFSDFSEILHIEAECHADRGQVTKQSKFRKFKMVHGHHIVNR